MEAPPLRVEVSYQLREYLATVSELMPYVQAARDAGVRSRDMHALREIPAPGAPVPLWRRLLVLPMAGLVFFVKKAKVGTCVFRIDSDGITRESKGAPVRVAWSDIIRVFRFSQCYLITKAEGAMPIPYRCLGSEQQEAVEQLLFAKGL